MCLDTVDEEPKVGRNYGYKFFSSSKGMLCSAVWVEVYYKTGEWQRDSAKGNIKFRYPKGYGYPKGYHIFASLVGLESWLGTADHFLQVRRVWFDDVVATGTQEGVRVIVARKIKIGSKEYNKKLVDEEVR